MTTVFAIIGVFALLVFNTWNERRIDKNISDPYKRNQKDDHS